MKEPSGGLVWHTRDILSGRRSHWNSTCVPVLLTAYQQAETLKSPLRKVFELLLAASWTAFRADFSQGIFQRWQKSLDANRTKRLLGIYLAHLLQVSVAQGLWADLGIPDEQVWNAAMALLPEVGRLRVELGNLDGEGLAQKLSSLHITLLSIVANDQVVELSSSDDFFQLRYYHPKLFIDLSKRIALELSTPDAEAGRFSADPQFGDHEMLFATLERLHGEDYEAMINRIYDAFGRASGGRVMLLPEELASALDQTREAPSRETWLRLKAAMPQHRKR